MLLLVNATNYNGKTVCGLCGMLDGTLVYSDGKTQVTAARDKNVITTFAKIWLVNPGEHIVWEVDKNVVRHSNVFDVLSCLLLSILGNDRIVSDPLFATPLHLFNTSLNDLSLCFEIKDSYDPDKHYLAKVTPPSGHTVRQFIGELYNQSWDPTLKSIYAGIHKELKDSVIEGAYTNYDGLVGTTFKNSSFDTSL